MTKRLLRLGPLKTLNNGFPVGIVDKAVVMEVGLEQMSSGCQVLVHERCPDNDQEFSGEHPPERSEEG